MSSVHWLDWISFLGTGLASLGAVTLARLAYEDFKKRRKEREARSVRIGIIFLFVGFLLAAGSYFGQTLGWCGFVLLLALTCMGALLGFFGFRSRRSSMWESEKKAIIEAAQEMARKGLVVGMAGNVSLRLNDPGGRELLAITPSGCRYESLKVDDIVIVDFEGQRVEGKLKASIETVMHVEVYKARKKINAIVHAHPVFCSALAVAGMDIPPLIDEQVVLIGGEIKVAEYALPGTPELARSAVAALGPRNAVILANHGVLAVGRDMREALTICELAEEIAKIYVSALSLGKVNPVSAEVVELEKAFFASVYGESEP
jgi:L-fuculose-phosphate aldolase